jgi:hypothetical protein
MNKNGGWFLGTSIFVIIALLFGVGAAYGNGKSLIDEKVYMGMVSHTEYMSAETGQIVARIVDFQGTPIVASCYATIIYPNKTIFVNNASMTASTIGGDYYKTFTTPIPEGVYEYQANCYYSPNKKQSATNSFHLSPALNTIGEVNSTLNNMYLSMGSNFTRLYSAIQGMNATMISQFTGLNASVAAQLAALNSSLALQIANLNISVDLTPLMAQLNAVNVSIINRLNTFDARFNSIDGNLTLVLARELQINNTVNNIWDKVSLNLTVELDNMQVSLAQVLKNTNEINGTVNTIKSNQENQVYMQVVSG